MVRESGLDLVFGLRAWVCNPKVSGPPQPIFPTGCADYQRTEDLPKPPIEIRPRRDAEFEPSKRPLSGMPTYTANLCPLCGRVEFASLGEDFGKAIRKSIEAASRRAVRQGTTENLDG